MSAAEFIVDIDSSIIYKEKISRRERAAPPPDSVQIYCGNYNMFSLCSQDKNRAQERKKREETPEFSLLRNSAPCPCPHPGGRAEKMGQRRLTEGI
jgi:hypothetical protein